jgi:hypothetical protein
VQLRIYPSQLNYNHCGCKIPKYTVILDPTLLVSDYLRRFRSWRWNSQVRWQEVLVA